MRTLLNIQNKLVPDLVQVLRKRYDLMQSIRHLQPVGRRALAQNLQTTERILRSEVELLKDMGLIHVSPIGMSCTEEGIHLLKEMDSMADELFGFNDLALQLQQILHIPKVIVVAGDVDVSEWGKKELGRVGARILKQVVQEGDVVAVTGGSTIVSVAEHVTPSSHFRDVQFVPARGGLGEKVEMQANTIASSLAAKSGGTYHLLHVPDRLSPDVVQSLLGEAQVAEVMQLLHKARVVIHGIGDGMAMAMRRKYTEEELEVLRELGAVGEAFGYYFNAAGETIYKMPTIGLSLEDVKRADVVLSLGGGSSKAKAIMAFAKQACQTVLITDEGAARAILEEHRQSSATI
ncbi:central glycolytic genes regulator [Brevibacillus halotolerans]|uniref:sugar-binding transcriptional regulator n=1 Tax=Brevibacillus halotolerans TaxID=1507437 RepID=UPI001B01EE50|nr:sugar-binding domain-containing protein [Brevibacillus halotolerans]GIO01905.1 central glycolytic genes regulator [Brevibacillus halotolerans]